jgi:ABC-type thiamin/hydroxymethylpyrimidine transport system permease subunit
MPAEQLSRRVHRGGAAAGPVLCGGHSMTARVSASVLAALLVPRLAGACPVCFGASDGPILQGSNMGIAALLVVTLAMLGAFAAFFATLARRASRPPEEGRSATGMRQSHSELAP